MMTTSTIKSQFFKLFIACFFLTTSYALLAQDPQTLPLKDFKIQIEKPKSGFQLKSFNGSAWINLGFTAKQDKPQAIDEYGMAELDSESQENNPDFADYLFTITKRKNEIELKGYKGTAWKELTFTLPRNGKQIIDQTGMTDQ